MKIKIDCSSLAWTDISIPIGAKNVSLIEIHINRKSSLSVKSVTC